MLKQGAKCIQMSVAFFHDHPPPFLPCPHQERLIFREPANEKPTSEFRWGGTDKTDRVKRGKGSGSVYSHTKLTALDYVNGDDMRYCRGLGLRWMNKVGGYYSP